MNLIRLLEILLKTTGKTKAEAELDRLYNYATDCTINYTHRGRALSEYGELSAKYVSRYGERYVPRKVRREHGDV